MNIIENSYEYIGHKLLWYIDLILQGIKFPSMKDKIEFDRENNYTLIKIFLWLVSFRVAKSLIEFDSYSYFRILLKFFKDKNYLNLISNISKDNFDKIQKEEQLSYVLIG